MRFSRSVLTGPKAYASVGKTQRGRLVRATLSVSLLLAISMSDAAGQDAAATVRKILPTLALIVSRTGTDSVMVGTGFCFWSTLTKSYFLTEHYYQAQKSFDPAYRIAIMASASPGAAKRLAIHPFAPRRRSKHSWFKKNGAAPRSDWNEIKLDIMRRADLAKFTQHPELRERLLATGNAELIEDSPSEPYWGIGSSGDGLNWAGRILMEIRARVG